VDPTGFYTWTFIELFFTKVIKDEKATGVSGEIKKYNGGPRGNSQCFDSTDYLPRYT
jgi:hypothetical protein